MAGDWIKMRSNLRTHPKVVRIASATKADRLRVVGGLHAVWCLFDEHSVDGQLHGYTPSAVDDEIGWPGFADLMIGVDWLSWDGNDGLVLPDFSTHNGASAKRRAQETDRKRAERSASEKLPQPVLKMSANNADKKRTREEKRREDIDTPLPPAAETAGVTLESWSAFAEMRRTIKKPMTDRAVEMMAKQLAKLAGQGWDPNELLDASTRNSWQDVYPEKVQRRVGGMHGVAL